MQDLILLLAGGVGGWILHGYWLKGGKKNG